MVRKRSSGCWWLSPSQVSRPWTRNSAATSRISPRMRTAARSDRRESSDRGRSGADLIDDAAHSRSARLPGTRILASRGMFSHGGCVAQGDLESVEVVFPELRYDRLCRTAHSEAYLLSESNSPFGRVDLHF